MTNSIERIGAHAKAVVKHKLTWKHGRITRAFEAAVNARR